MADESHERALSASQLEPIAEQAQGEPQERASGESVAVAADTGLAARIEHARGSAVPRSARR